MPPKRKSASAGPEKSPKKRKVSNESVKGSTEKHKASVKAAKKETTSSPKAPVGESKTTTTSANLKSLLKDEKWMKALSAEFDKNYFTEIEKKLAQEYKEGKEIFPPKELIFNAFNLTPLDKVRVVILGQDPYHDDGQAMGLCFSVPKVIKTPPSLKNIYTELERDPQIVGFKAPDHGCLQRWAENGILLLNATLTVEAHKANSHAKFGWQTFTDAVIKVISDQCSHVVFILWGGFAHKKEKLIDSKKHGIVKTAHPSPLSAGKFKNCGCFSSCNTLLKSFDVKPVDWSL